MIKAQKLKKRRSKWSELSIDTYQVLNNVFKGIIKICHKLLILLQLHHLILNVFPKLENWQNDSWRWIEKKNSKSGGHQLMIRGLKWGGDSLSFTVKNIQRLFHSPVLKSTELYSLSLTSINNYKLRKETLLWNI